MKLNIKIKKKYVQNIKHVNINIKLKLHYLAYHKKKIWFNSHYALDCTEDINPIQPT